MLAKKPILPPVSISTIYHDSLSLWSTSLCTLLSLLPLPKLWRQWAPGCDHIGSDLHSAFWAFTVYVFCRSFMFNLRCFTSGFSSRYIFLVTVPLVLHHVPSQPNQGFGCRVWCDFGSGCHLSHHGWFVAAVASDSQPITSTCCLWAQLYFFLCILISVFLIFVRGQCAFLGPYCNCAGLDLKHSCYWPTSPVPKKIRLFWKRSHMLPSCQRSLPLGKHPSGIALPMWLSWRSATFPQVESDILRRSWRSNIAGLNLLQKKIKTAFFIPAVLTCFLLGRPISLHKGSTWIVRRCLPNHTARPRNSKLWALHWQLALKGAVALLWRSLLPSVWLWDALGLERLRYFEVPHRHSCYFWELWGSLCSWCSVGFANDIFEGEIQTHDAEGLPQCHKVTTLHKNAQTGTWMERSTPNICMLNVSLCAYLCSSCMSRHEPGSKSKVSESISEQCTLFTCKRRNDPPESKQACFVCAWFSVGMPSSSFQ